jgi:cytochrome b subunit of formate dehydrogenase
MLHGYVDEQYAKNHHPLWYEEVMAGEGQAESVGGAPSPAPAAPEK